MVSPRVQRELERVDIHDVLNRVGSILRCCEAHLSCDIPTSGAGWKGVWGAGDRRGIRVHCHRPQAVPAS
jgi:hypothetical protein